MEDDKLIEVLVVMVLVLVLVLGQLVSQSESGAEKSGRTPGALGVRTRAGGGLGHFGPSKPSTGFLCAFDAAFENRGGERMGRMRRTTRNGPKSP